jgi:hypothetical protein
MGVLADLVQQSTATTGTGTLTLGAAVTGFRTVAGAGIADGVVVSYAIQDGTNRETGTGTIGGSGTTLTRTLLASSTGSLLNLSGSAVVGIAPNAADFDFTGVTSVGGTGTVSGLTLSGTVTSTGNLTLGGALSVSGADFGSQTANQVFAAPNGSNGNPSFRAIVAADIPTLNQSTTGSAATLTTARDIAMTGDVAWSVSFNGSANATAAGTIANAAVTFAKIQNVAGNSVLGRAAAGGGDLSEIAIGSSQLFGRGATGNLTAITLGTNLSMSGTTLNAAGGGIGKQTIFVPASSMLPRITNGPSLGSLETATNRVNVSTLDFDPTTQEFAQFQIAMPKSWDEGTVTYEVIWYHPSTTTNFGVVWSLAGVALSDTNALDTAFGTAVQVTDTGGTTNALYDSPESTAVTIGNVPAENDYVIFQIARVPADGSDTMAVDARLLGIRLFYTTNAGNDA